MEKKNKIDENVCNEKTKIIIDIEDNLVLLYNFMTNYRNNINLKIK